MRRPLRFILALPMIALVVMHTGSPEALGQSRPMAGIQAPRASGNQSDPSPGAPPCTVRCTALPRAMRYVALPDKPEPRLAERFASPVGSLRPEAYGPGPKAGPGRSPAKRDAWLLLALAQHGAAGFDAYTTRQAVDAGHPELDPLIRPFAHSPAIYPAIQAGPALLDFLGYRMMTSRRRWARRIWWLPQAVATAGFIWAGAHNLSLPAPRKR
jgi:hypothetical protein